MKFQFVVIAAMFASTTLSAGEYFVAKVGSDGNPGSSGKPFLTIQKAADVLLPGDICTIRKGVYREYINPRKGGESEEKRIVYRAAAGEDVVIKGSERVSSWVSVGRGVWKVELPESFFAGYNPFRLNLYCPTFSLTYGREYHLGTVYIDEVPLTETFLERVVKETAGNFMIQQDPVKTVILANFGAANPNTALTEVNVRESLFTPQEKGLRYITVDGLTLAQGASNFNYWTGSVHAAMLNTNRGRSWVVQNCTFTDAKNVALTCGNSLEDAQKKSEFDYQSIGHHIIRNNTFRRCGEGAITGWMGFSASTIEGNLFEDFNPTRQVGGYETSALKVFMAVDLVIKSNVFRNMYVHSKSPENAVIWIDWASQNVRITGNVIYNFEGWPMFIQNCHASPTLVDNNIIVGTIQNTCSGGVWVHNLFVNAPQSFAIPNYLEDIPRWKPHTGSLITGVDNLSRPRDDVFYNNIYIGKGTDNLESVTVRRKPRNQPEIVIEFNLKAQNFRLDWNVFYDGAAKCSWADQNSIVHAGFTPGVTFKSLPDGVEVSFASDNAPSQVRGPFISPRVIGTFALTGQTLEDKDGNPIVIDRDLLGMPRTRSHPTAGPVENLSEMGNSIKLMVGSRANRPTTQ